MERLTAISNWKKEKHHTAVPTIKSNLWAVWRQHKMSLACMKPAYVFTDRHSHQHKGKRFFFFISHPGWWLWGLPCVAVVGSGYLCLWREVSLLWPWPWPCRSAQCGRISLSPSLSLTHICKPPTHPPLYTHCHVVFSILAYYGTFISILMQINMVGF